MKRSGYLCSMKLPNAKESNGMSSPGQIKEPSTHENNNGMSSPGQIKEPSTHEKNENAVNTLREHRIISDKVQADRMDRAREQEALIMTRKSKVSKNILVQYLDVNTLKCNGKNAVNLYARTLVLLRKDLPTLRTTDEDKTREQNPNSPAGGRRSYRKLSQTRNIVATLIHSAEEGLQNRGILVSLIVETKKTETPLLLMRKTKTQNKKEKVSYGVCAGSVIYDLFS